MKYINILKNSSLKMIYKKMAFEAFDEWNTIINYYCNFDDEKEFIELFCKHLYKAKINTLKTYPNTSSDDNEKLGYFIGYFSSTLSISWKSKYYLRYQKDYDKLVWLQTIVNLLRLNDNSKKASKIIYSSLMDNQSGKFNVFDKNSEIDLSRLDNLKFKINDDDIDKNMLYLISLVLDKLDIKKEKLFSINSKYMREFRIFINE